MLYSLHASASLRQTNYRWRNDDGTEASATWKAAVNTPITINDTSTLRLRLEMDNDNEDGDLSTVEDVLQYSTDSINWTSITNTTGQPFAYQSSTNVTNQQATTNQMGSGTFGTYVAGHIISQLPGASTMNLNDAERTELEWVIRPTAYALPNTTYYFQVTGQEDVTLHFGKLFTGCIGVYILTKKDSARCGPGAVQLSATCASNATIEWYDAQTGGNLVGTGTTFVTPVLSSSKLYYASAKLTVGASCSSQRTAVTATINPVPIVNLGNDVTVCANTPVTFNPGGAYTYIWDNGSSIISRTVTAPGTYFVTATGVGNCKNSDTVKLLNNPRPIVNLGNDTLICPGQTVVFDAKNPGDTYLWSNGSTNQTITVGTAGDYSVVVTNEFNCTGTDIVNVIVKDLPLGEINAVHGDTATYTFDVAGALYAVDYVWDFGDGTPAVHGFSSQHKYTHNGIYTVNLAMLGDCDTNSYRQRTVDVYDVPGNTTGVGNATLKNAISMYPNPAKETIYLGWSTSINVNNVEIFDILGQRVSTIHVASKNNIAIQTGQLSNGVYSIRINTDKGFVVEKMEIRK